MENKLHRHIILLLFCLLAAKAIPQDKDSQAVYNYRETVWLTSDRHLFLPGEIINFNARVFEQDTYLKSQLSKNIRIELLDSKGYPLNQQNLILKDAAVTGTVFLPKEAGSGWYYLRAYTNWMRNFPSNEFGLLAVKVVNPQTMDPQAINQNSEKISLKLFPQGKETGLFAGYDERLGISLDGCLINTRGDTLTSFLTHASGWAQLPVQLSDDEQYVVSLKDFPANQYTEQPDINKTGTLNIDLKKDDEYVFVVISGESPAETKDYKLMIHQSYTLYWESKENSQDKSQFRIPRSILPSGIIQFSIIGNNNQILARRLWSDINIKELDIDLPPEENLELRSPYSIDFKFPAESADLSVLIGQVQPNNPLENCIPGVPGWHCSANIPIEKNAFQGWLMGHSYPDDVVYSLMDIVQEDFQATLIKYLPETSSGIISGIVSEKLSGLGVENIGICITVLNNNYFDACKTDVNGQFYFALAGLSGSTDYILNFTSETDSGLQILVNSVYAGPLRETIPQFSLNKDELNFLQDQNINLQIQKIYGVLPEFIKPLADSTQERKTFFHPPDKTTILDNYIKLANIREVIYEVVPNVAVRKKNGRDYLKVFSDNPVSANYETLVLLDGIPLANQKHLLNLSPGRIEKIEVKNKPYIHGRSFHSAIINFVSPNRDYAGLDLPENSVLSTLNLPLKAVEYKLLKEDDPQNLPLLENTLLWKSDHFSRNGSVDFMTKDLNGDFQIMIFGFDNSGNWVSGIKKIKIH